MLTYFYLNIFRAGQEKPICVLRLTYAGLFDKKLREIQLEKMMLQSLVNGEQLRIPVEATKCMDDVRHKQLQNAATNVKHKDEQMYPTSLHLPFYVKTLRRLNTKIVSEVKC